MKKTPPVKARRNRADELRREYSFDYTKARPNRFASGENEGRMVVVLDEDIAQVFRTPESVIQVLRALIANMPTPKRKSRG